MTIPAAYFAPLPPSVADDPTAFGISLCGLMIVTFCFMDWVYRFGWQFIDNPKPIRNPLTALRAIFFLTGLSGIIRNGPDVLSWGLWKVTSAQSRFELAHWNRVLDGASAPLQSLANILVGTALPVIIYQLSREPIPVELYPTREKIQRQVSMIALAMFFSAAIAFYK